MIRNRQRERQEAQLPSTITPEQLGRAMKQLDLSSVPPDKRKWAVAEHLHRIMQDTLEDRTKAPSLLVINPNHLRR